MYRPSGAHFTYAHAPNLRETPIRGMCTLCPLSEFEGSATSWRLVSLWRPAKSGRHVCPKADALHRKQRLPTDTAEETETRLGSCPSAVYAYTMFILSTFCYNRFSSVILMHGKNQQVWICCVHIR